MNLTDKISVYNMDCMKYMKHIPDNAFDLAIVDPPYGIGKSGQKEYKGNPGHNRKKYEFKGWDKKTPSKKYFNNLFRVSKNQIICGGNYFASNLKSSMGWIVWDKGQRGLGNSDGELIYTSFNRALRIPVFNRKLIDLDGSIHPTQKPVKLYEWILKNYANEGDRILDTHLGSGSSAIACHNYGFEFVGCELDEDYYNDMVKRFREATSQIHIFAQ